MQQQSPYGQGPGFAPPGPVGPRALGPGGRVAGALICVALIAVEIAWTVRDIRYVGFHDMFRSWLGLDVNVQMHAVLATGTMDGVLLVLLLGALVWAPRPGAGWTFVTAGVFAFGYRLPGWWIFQSDWTAGSPMHSRALATAVCFTLAGIALVVIGLAGRRPVPGPGPGGLPGGLPSGAPVGVRAGGLGAAPVGPRRAAAVTAGVLLVLFAVEEIGWQIFYLHKYTTANGYPPDFYPHLLTGKGTLSTLLGMPAAYSGWLWVALALLTAVVAFSNSAAARPLGIAFGFAAVVFAVVSLDVRHSQHMLFEFDHLPTYLKTEQVLLVVELLMGLVVLVLLAVPGGRPGGPRPMPGWGPPQPYDAAPGSAPGAPPGFAPAPGGWGQSPQPSPPSPYTQQPQPPQQPPAAGGFGPPPQLPPPFPPQAPPDYPAPPPGFPQEPGGGGR